MQFFNDESFERIRNAVSVTKTGVRNGFVENFVLPEKYEELMDTFPDPSTFTLVDKDDSGGGHKRFYIGPAYLASKHFGSAYHMKTEVSPVWQEFLAEMGSQKFIQKLSEATGTTLNSLNAFGTTYGNEGCEMGPHIDGAIRPGNTTPIKGTIALLMYLNREPDPTSITELYDTDRTTVLAKGTTMRNSVSFFEQHPNAWHGFPKVPEGHDRRLLSFTFSLEKKPIELDWSYIGSVVPIGKWKWQLAKLIG